jgi:hypothetical protein
MRLSPVSASSSRRKVHVPATVEGAVSPCQPPGKFAAQKARWCHLSLSSR